MRDWTQLRHHTTKGPRVFSPHKPLYNQKSFWRRRRRRSRPPHPHNDLKTSALQLFCNTSLSDLSHKYERCKLSVKNSSERKLQLFVNMEKINISQGQHVSRRRAGICCGMAMKRQNTEWCGRWKRTLGLVIQGVWFVLSTKLHTCLNPAS